VTRWASDPFALGSFSYVAVGSSGENYEALAKPVDNLFFAGEATHRHHPSTVAGAYMSGIRAALEIGRACTNRVITPVVPIPTNSTSETSKKDVVMSSNPSKSNISGLTLMDLEQDVLDGDLGSTVPQGF